MYGLTFASFLTLLLYGFFPSRQVGTFHYYLYASVVEAIRASCSLCNGPLADLVSQVWAATGRKEVGFGIACGLSFSFFFLILVCYVGFLSSQS